MSNQLKVPPFSGQIVDYYPMDCSVKKMNGILKKPAIVFNSDTCPDLHVMNPSEKVPVSFIKTVSHKDEYVEGQRGYWDYTDYDKAIRKQLSELFDINGTGGK